MKPSIRIFVYVNTWFPGEPCHRGIHTLRLHCSDRIRGISSLVTTDMSDDRHWRGWKKTNCWEKCFSTPHCVHICISVRVRDRICTTQLELLPCGCMPLCTNHVAVYIHVCPDIIYSVQWLMESFSTWCNDNHLKLNMSRTNSNNASSMDVTAEELQTGNNPHNQRSFMVGPSV